MASVDIVASDPGWGETEALGSLVEAAVAAAIRVGGRRVRPAAELAVVLADDATLQRLNREWRGKDKPTNVLSFPVVAPEGLAKAAHLGDVAIARETLLAEAAGEGKPWHDHLAHLVVHGVLHLLGHDHETAEAAEAMEALERQALDDLGIADPYAGTEPAPAEAAP
jgi:probable rRNA maturation factor